MVSAISLVLVVASAASGQKTPRPPLRPLDLHSKDDFQVSEIDRFTHVQKLFTYPREIARSGCTLGACEATISASWRRLITTPIDTMFVVAISYCGVDWQFIPETGSVALQFIANDEEISLRAIDAPDREVGDRGPGKHASESVPLIISSQQLFTLARADSGYWRLQGAHGYREGKLEVKRLLSLRLFLATVFPDSAIYDKP
jgi:hypothetical protein